MLNYDQRKGQNTGKYSICPLQKKFFLYFKLILGLYDRIQSMKEKLDRKGRNVSLPAEGVKRYKKTFI